MNEWYFMNSCVGGQIIIRVARRAKSLNIDQMTKNDRSKILED